MKKFSLLSIAFIISVGCSTPTTTINNSINSQKKEAIQQDAINNANIVIPKTSQQLIMVTTENWHTKDGTLQRYEKRDNIWQKVGQTINIVLGRNGLGWGKGLHLTPDNAKYIKKEGDGKAPAGLFSLGNGFGYKTTNFTMQFPYAKYKTTDHCVDDANSQWYNQIIDSKTTAKDYKSFEHMKLRNNLYKYGITVNHNPENIAQAGSCIFIHIKNKSGKGTAGCTAMREDQIVTLLKWLKEEDKPLLLQLPKEEMVKVNLN